MSYESRVLIGRSARMCVCACVRRGWWWMVGGDWRMVKRPRRKGEGGGVILA